MSLAYLNGDYMALEECKISVLDRGFIFGDGVYELIPAYGNKPFQLARHLKRLARSLDQIGIQVSHNDQQWQEIIQALINAYEFDQCSIYIQITRGVAARDHAYPQSAAPTIFVMVNPWPKLSESHLTQGLTAVTLEDIRWDRCDIKVTSLLANVMMKQQAVQQQAHEAILIRDGQVLEGSSSNVFVVQAGQVFTSEKNNLVLPGITRDVVIELCQQCDIPMIEEAVSVDSLSSADEIWITSSTKECLPITQLNGQAVNNAHPGKLWRQVYDAFQTMKAH
jgi:D-alanine transaminase